jgi:threonine dehydrogenase-like Zn-dependent dehydrogenase
MVEAGLFPGPFPVGHELVGEVAATGSAVTSLRPGDRVVSSFQVSCGSCPPCRAGRFAACATHRAPAGAAFGFGPAGGGHGGAVADLLLVPHADHLLLPAPSGVAPAALAPVADNVADAYRAVAPYLAIEPGADVLVVGGAGDSIGYYAVLLAAALGAGRVRYADREPGRCAIAERLGAEVELVGDAWPRRFDRARITVAFSREHGGLLAALRSTDDYGFCTLLAIHFEPATPLPLLELYTKGITMHTSRADSRRLLPDVLALVGDGSFDPLEVPTTIAGWGDAATAWTDPGTKLVVEQDA